MKKILILIFSVLIIFVTSTFMFASAKTSDEVIDSKNSVNSSVEESDYESSFRGDSEVITDYPSPAEQIEEDLMNSKPENRKYILEKAAVADLTPSDFKNVKLSKSEIEILTKNSSVKNPSSKNSNSVDQKLMLLVLTCLIIVYGLQYRKKKHLLSAAKPPFIRF